MAYTTITKPTQGHSTKKTLADLIIDDIDYLYDNIGGGILIENGSFERGASPYDPTGWVSYKWGTGDIETTDPLHGKQGYKFVSSGSGGGYLTMQDFAEISESDLLLVWWKIKSSVADIKNIVRLLWYKKDQTACTTASTDIYNENAANPTTGKRYGLFVAPPADARYFKLRLIGADSSNATPGSCIFDGVGALEFYGEPISLSGTIAEQTTTSSTYGDKGSFTLNLPAGLPATAVVEIVFKAAAKATAGDVSVQRFRIGSDYSNEISTYSASYLEGFYTILYTGIGGDVTVYQQIKNGDGAQTAYGKKDEAWVSCRIINIRS